MNVVLIGYRGAGKSTVGRRLALRLQRRFVDTDEILEQQHMASIGDIVEIHGWAHFRALEKGIVEEISKEDNLVIAPGGGAVLDPGNVMVLKRNGLMIWLKADQHVLRIRMEQDPQTLVQRPTLTGMGALEELEELIAFRSPFYEKAAEVQLDTSTLDAEAAVEAVLSILRKRMRGG